MQPRDPATLVDVFVLRRLGKAAACETGYPEGHLEGRQFESCLRLHGVVRQRSYLTADGRRMLCHFRAPDAESLRMALRGARVEYDEVWTARDKREDKAIADTKERKS